MAVGGRVEPGDYVVDRETLEIVERKIGSKKIMTAIEGEVRAKGGIE